MSSALPTTDFERDYILTGKAGKLNSVKIPDLQYTTFGKLLIYRLMHDRDMKILITSQGKTTGTGKTTLAIHLARYVNAVRNELFDRDAEWSAEEYAFMDTFEYLRKYSNSNKGDCLITDELEYLMDNRRWMKDSNVKFSQAWSILRYRNVVTIGTAPGLSDLDKRVKEAADIWINVLKPGKAGVYQMTYDEWEERPMRYPLRRGKFREYIHWNELDDDPDYEWLAEQKEEMGVPGIDENQKEQKTPKEIRREVRDNGIKEAIKINRMKGNPLAQADIGDIFGMSQKKVSDVKREMKKNGELPEKNAA